MRIRNHRGTFGGMAKQQSFIIGKNSYDNTFDMFLIKTNFCRGKHFSNFMGDGQKLAVGGLNYGFDIRKIGIIWYERIFHIFHYVKKQN